ncbi:hypothetical protein CHLRE_08g361250v5 [Chlamydomonas reinhardtii]|uniref:Uncharacterized protein n=1 Tax=Chlamydomonas reinhardtii TaxID=3055 RepID=A0A2K3DGH7_CHLRE|nr:uncharacterized protein CHLRE_08g361250v5 [Chlamydomonas reinhardtii]PNW79644.1 hypothetical protein CHLRE_08g361250v5 [Chlamydomonas reinhardtii]
MLSQPSVFVSRAVLRIRSRNQAKQQGEGEGQEQGQGQLQQQPAPQCARYVGLQYLQAIRESRVALCVPPSQQGQAGGGGDGGRRRSLDFRSSRSGRSSLGDGGFGEQALWGGQGEGVSGAEDWHPLHSHSLSHSRSQSQSHSHSHGLRHLSEAAGKGKDEAEPEEPEARGRAGAAAALPAAEGGSRTKRRRRRLEKRGGSGGGADGDDDVGGPLPATESSVDCYTAPFVRAGDSAKATVSLCRSRNLLLNSCELFAFRRPGTLSKKFPAPAAGAVRLACEMRDGGAMAAEDPGALGFLRSMNSAVWWANATRDDAAVAAACAPGSPTLVTTPTLFVLRDRHSNYAHEMEVVSMAFSFLAALEPRDVAEQGVQVVITDQAPPTGFLETWARISRPHRLRVLAQDPFPPGTCFASAFHVYTFAAGIGYNTNADTVRCESPVVAGLSGWLRQMYGQADPNTAPPAAEAAGGGGGGGGGGGSVAGAAAIAGPATAAAGVRGLRPPAGGIVLKNVVWLSRRNLETVRLLLNASAGWKSMRMVRNEDAVVAGLVAAVQQWNAQSCLLRRFDRAVKAEYERSFVRMHGVHAAAVAGPTTTSSREQEAATAGGGGGGAGGGGAVGEGGGGGGGAGAAAAGREGGGRRSSRRRGLLRRLLAAVKGGAEEKEEEADEEEEAEAGVGMDEEGVKEAAEVEGAGQAAAASVGGNVGRGAKGRAGQQQQQQQHQHQQQQQLSSGKELKKSSKSNKKKRINKSGRLSAEDLAELERMIAEEEGRDEEEDEEALAGIRQRDELLDFLAGVTAADGSSIGSSGGSSSGSSRRRRRLHAHVAQATGEGGGEEDEEEEEEEDGNGGGGVAAAATAASTATTAAAGGAAAANATISPKAKPQRPSYMIGSSIVDLEKLWALDEESGESCRRTNVLFKFVDGDFNELTYHQQLQVIFRTGVLAGVHGAGLTHGYFLAPGQSAVLQLLGDSFKEVSANNVFRNMAASCGNHYADVLYRGVDVDVPQLQAAARSAMDFVAGAVMEAQERRSGPLRLVLDDQTHFNVVSPPLETCPAAAQGNTGR